MFVTSVSLVCVLSLVSGNVLYFKPHHQQNEVVSEFDQVPEEQPDIIVYDPVVGHESKVPAKVESPFAEHPLRSVMCPGGKSECPDDNTCCKLSNGRYGCCPYPDAVCCSDMRHCCPSGYTCDLVGGHCKKGHLSMPLSSKLSASKRISDVKEVKGSSRLVEGSMIDGPLEICSGGEQACRSGYSCCSNANGTYSCCGYSPAHCCADKEHCCPANYKCLSDGRCEDKNGLTLPRSLKIEATSIKVKANVTCRDKSQCTVGNTCCLKGTNVYGCCPLPNAVCCSDKKHCCPYGYACGPTVGYCKKGYHIIDLSKENNLDLSNKLPADPKDTDVDEVNAVSNVICPDKQSSCPNGQTCCKQSSGNYGCCPVPNAVCCSDMIHCCPQDTTCDVSQGKCMRGDYSIDWFEKSPSFSISKPAGAVCCGDDRCCPEGTTCDPQSKSCIKERSDQVTEWLTNVKALTVQNVVCPDGRSECPTGNTCCRGEGNVYGCCPQPNAVCCEDKKHCCPENTKCDPTNQKCLRSNGLLSDWFEKTKRRTVVSSSVICPDGQSQCPEGNTCCALGGGSYGCCPVPNAVCCSDKKHCCPQGYTCNTGSAQCTKNNGLTITWLEKTESQPMSTNVMCPDGKSECPSGSTCCEIGGGKYGCCPKPNAVCCDDDKHCCPNGFTCDTGSGKCLKNNGLSIDWFAKTESGPVSSSVNCPDGKSECKSGYTCCKLGDGRYGCCPLPNAVCCDDEKHCCPNGYTCSTGTGKCTKNNGLSIDWFAKTESRAVSSDVVCPDGKSECKSGNTCCKLGDGRYGCCPLPNAVCCDDEKHCCPNGYTCSTGTGKCTKNNGLSIDWFAKTESRAVSSDVVCPDGKSECKSGNTCCKLSDGRYGCCPRPNAVCCNDGQHCCPQNTECDVAHGTCISSHGSSHNWLEKTESLPVVIVTDIVCPDEKSQCPPGNTCCLVGANIYGCCARPNAVCCADMKHCCPEHTTCSTSNGTCISTNGVSMTWLDKSPSMSVPQHISVISPATYDDEQATSVVCPDGGSCLDDQTCCNVTAEKYGCCAYPNAVCCPDGLYCCPKEYICDGNMICRDPNDVNRKDSSTNLLLQRITRKIRDRN